MTIGPPRHRPRPGPDELPRQDLDEHCSDSDDAEDTGPDDVPDERREVTGDPPDGRPPRDSNGGSS